MRVDIAIDSGGDLGLARRNASKLAPESPSRPLPTAEPVVLALTKIRQKSQPGTSMSTSPGMIEHGFK